MKNRDANYSAFYVDEPFIVNGLRAYSAKDFCYYQILKAWKGIDSSFPFVDAHDKTYNVRDGSDWDKTLKPRLHERLSLSANVILFLSKNTKNSKALQEEINYAINTLGLPIIVVYPDYKTKEDIHNGTDFTTKIKLLWEKLPIFRDNKWKVPVLHIPISKELIYSALKDKDMRIATKGNIRGDFYYK